MKDKFYNSIKVPTKIFNSDEHLICALKLYLQDNLSNINNNGILNYYHVNQIDYDLQNNKKQAKSIFCKIFGEDNQRFYLKKYADCIRDGLELIFSCDQEILYEIVNNLNITDLPSFDFSKPYEKRYCSLKTQQNEKYPVLIAQLDHKVSYYLITENSSDIQKVFESEFGETFTKTLAFQSDTSKEGFNFEEKDIKDFLQNSLVTGNTKNVDLSVGDIYGSDFCNTIKLAPDLLACSLGKIDNFTNPNANFERQDFQKSLMIMQAQSCCQITNLLAKSKGCKSVVFLLNEFESDGFKYVFHSLTNYYKSLETTKSSEIFENVYFTENFGVLANLGVLCQFSN